jgi:tetratricopeptide (TPR) repeat protein
MTPSFLFRALTLTVVCSLALPVAADEPIAKAENVRDRAIAKGVAWRAKTGENILENQQEYKSAGSFKTAEGYLVALRGVNNDQDQLKRGLEMLSGQAAADPADPVAEFYRGEVLKWLDRSEDARSAWRNAAKRAAKLVEKDPTDARAQYYLGAASVRLREPGKARTALAAALEGGFFPDMTHFEIGLSHVLQEQWQQAVTSFDEVEKIDPRFAHLYFYRGLTWDKLGRKDKLFNDLDQFVKLAPNAPEADTARAILKSVK